MRNLRLFTATSIVALSAAGAFAQEIITGDEDIGTVVISDGLRGVSTDTAAPVTTIDQEELDARQATTTGQLLDTIPNVTLLNGATPQGAGINIRGLGSQAGLYSSDGTVSVVVDGVRSGAEEIYRNGASLGIEPELFEEVTVTRGPAGGFRFSTSAAGGTIELTTKDASDFLEDGESFAFRQKLGFETNGDRFLTTSIFAFKPDDNSDMLLFFGRRTSDEYEDGNGDIVGATDFDQRSALLKYNYNLSADSRITISAQENEIPERDVNYNVFDPNIDNFFGRVDRDTTDATAYIEFAYNPATNPLIDLTARLEFKREEIILDPVFNPFGTDLLDADHMTETLVFRVENQAQFTTGVVEHNLLAGFEVGERTRSSIGEDDGFNDSSAPGGTDDYLAIYLINDMFIGEKLEVTAALRYESQTLTASGNGPMAAVADGSEFKDDVLVGLLSAKYNVTDAFSVFGTYAENANMPILDNLFNDNIEETERFRTYELGASYDGFDVLTSGDSLQAKLTYFNTEVTNGRTYSAGQGRFLSDFEAEGIELEVAYEHPEFFVNVAAATNRGEVFELSDGTVVAQPFEQNTADNIEITVGRSFLDNQLDVFLTIDHNFANDRTEDGVFGELVPTFGGAFVPNTSPTAESEAFTLVDLGLGYTPTSGALEGTEFRASINNVFDEQYRAYGTSRFGEGRNVVFSIAKTF
ncbi:MAG: TonB-dependent receptor [Pseudomonadota bacterium]